MNSVIFPKSGKQLPLAVDIYQFCEMVSKSQDCVLHLDLADYKVLISIMMQRFKGEIDPSVFPLLCAKCATRLDQNTNFMQGIISLKRSLITEIEVVGTVQQEFKKVCICPVCTSRQGFIVYSKDKYIFDIPECSETDLKYIRMFFKYLATLWWPGDETESKICDQCCMSPIEPGEGYIYGTIEKDELHANRLICELCMTKMLEDPGLLEALKRDPYYLGNVVRQAREYAKSNQKQMSLPSAENLSRKNPLNFISHFLKNKKKNKS